MGVGAAGAVIVVISFRLTTSNSRSRRPTAVLSFPVAVEDFPESA